MTDQFLHFFSGSNLARDGLCGLSRRRKRFVQRGLRGTSNGKFKKKKLAHLDKNCTKFCIFLIPGSTSWRAMGIDRHCICWVLLWKTWPTWHLSQVRMIPWNNLEFPGIPWNSLEYLRILWSSLKFPGVLQNSLEFRNFRFNFIPAFRRCVQCLVHFFQLSNYITFTTLIFDWFAVFWLVKRRVLIPWQSPY